MPFLLYNYGTPYQVNGTATTNATTITPTSSAGWIEIRNKSETNELKISFDGGSNFFTIPQDDDKRFEGLIVSSFQIKAGSGTVDYEILCGIKSGIWEYALCTLDQLARYLKVENEIDTTHDDYDSNLKDLLEDCIDRASQYMETATDRKLVAQDITEYHDGDGQNAIQLNHYPVNTLSNVWDDPDRDFEEGGTYELTVNTNGTSNSEVAIDLDTGLMRLTRNATQSVFNDAILNVKINYNAGYVDVPMDLVQACIEIASVIYFRSKYSGDMRLGTNSITDNVGNTLKFTDKNTTEFAESVISKYARRM